MTKRYNTPKTAIPCIYLYDVAGLEGITNTGEYHNWDTIGFKTQHFIYTADDDRIVIQQIEGYFEISFQCSYKMGGAVPIDIRDRIRLNGTDIDGSTSQMSIDSTGQFPQHEGNNNIHIIVYLEPGDYIQVWVDTNPSGAVTKQNSSRLISKFIPMKGWNNSSGGQLDYKGGVMR